MGKAVTLGVLGSVLGVETTLVGIAWSILYYDFAGMYDLTVLTQNLPVIFPGILDHPCVPASLNVHVGNLLAGLVWLTLILSAALVLSLTLTGVGMYGLGGGKRGLRVVSPIFGAAASLLAAGLLVFGVAAGGSTPTFTSLIAPTLLTEHPIQYTILMGGVPSVNTLQLWLGLITLGVAIITHGATLITLRGDGANSNLRLAAGALSIASGITLIAGPATLWLAFIALSLTFTATNLTLFQSRKKHNRKTTSISTVG
nr:hypothetical protein [Candidatus Freyarchaeota archaeon]